MEFLHKNQKIILIALFFGGAIWAYLTFFKSDNVGVTSNLAAESVGSEVLELYTRLQAVTLDQTLFTSSLYRRLVDFSKTIPQQVPGRPNPFDIIGRD